MYFAIRIIYTIKLPVHLYSLNINIELVKKNQYPLWISNALGYWSARHQPRVGVG